MTCAAALVSTAACGTDTTGEAAAPAPSATAPAATSAAPAAGTKSRVESCKEVGAAGETFFKVLIEDAPVVKDGEPLPQDYVDNVHKEAENFAPALRTAAAGTSDQKARTAFEKYATNVETLVKSPDLEELNPETSDWLLDLATVCGDAEKSK